MQRSPSWILPTSTRRSRNWRAAVTHQGTLRQEESIHIPALRRCRGEQTLQLERLGLWRGIRNELGCKEVWLRESLLTLVREADQQQSRNSRLCHLRRKIRGQRHRRVSRVVSGSRKRGRQEEAWRRSEDKRRYELYMCIVFQATNVLH